MKPTAGSSHSREKKPCIISETYWKLYGTFFIVRLAPDFFLKKDPSSRRRRTRRRPEERRCFLCSCHSRRPCPPCPRRGIGQGKLSLSLSPFFLYGWVGEGGKERWRRRRRYRAVCQEEREKQDLPMLFLGGTFLKVFLAVQG